MACLNNIAAFRCRACGHLEHAGHAGDEPVPFACSVCGSGITLAAQARAKLIAELAHPDCTADRRVKIAAELGKLSDDKPHFDPSNWEVLADCTPERLAELGLTPDCVCKHEGKGGPRGGKAHAREAVDAAGTQDR